MGTLSLRGPSQVGQSIGSPAAPTVTAPLHGKELHEERESTSPSVQVESSHANVDALTPAPVKASGPHVPLGPWSFAHDPARHLDANVAQSQGVQGSVLEAFVREPAEPVSDPSYLATHVTNLSASVEQVFLPALRDGSLFTSFLDTLRAQHHLLMHGPAGSYRGLWGQAHQVDVATGRFIFEVGLQNGLSDRPAYTFDLGSRFGRYNDGVTEGPIHIEWLPEEALPRLRFTEMKVLHDSPVNAHMAALVERMRALLQLAFENLDTPRCLQFLSDYFHAASHTHLSIRGNNSLFMSHVNVALERAGLRPIPHGNLDIRAMKMHFDAFRPVFYDAVRAANPGVTLP